MSPALDAVLFNVALQQGAHGFTFEDLTRPATHQGATIGQTMDWLTRARASERVADVGFDLGADATDLGPRRYRINTPASQIERSSP
jgi:hypothetical protein